VDTFYLSAKQPFKLSEKIMKVQSLDHLNLTVSNLEESISWYAKIFGFKVVERGARDAGPWAIIRSGDAMLCIYEHPNRKAPSRFLIDDQERHVIYHFGLRITDRSAWLNTIQENQLELDFGGENIYPHSSSWYVVDPTGYSIEVALWNENIVRFDASDDAQEAA